MKKLLLIIILAYGCLSLNAQTHFTPAFTGNGQDHMNIYIINAEIFGSLMEAGDEIAAFDGNICCGVFVLTKPIDYTQGSLGTIKASRADEGVSNGYTSGHTVQLRFWDHSAGVEFTDINLEFFNTSFQSIPAVPYTAGESVFIKATVLNSIPVADAGSDQSVSGGQVITLDGSGSHDPDGQPLTYLWTAPAEITLSSTTVVNPTFTAPGVTSFQTLTFSLIVNDGITDSEADEVNITVLPAGSVIGKVFLEGSLVDPQNSSNYALTMRTTLNEKRMLPGQTYEDWSGDPVYSPAGQPYNIAPWNYSGTEGAGFDSNGNVNAGDAGYPATVVDWVLVSLRTTAGSDFSTVCRKAALLNSDGTIQMVSGFESCGSDISGNYYLVVEHYNHLIVMSDVAVPVTGGSLTYDFTLQQSYIDPNGFGSVGQKLIIGKYAMYGGNGNQIQTSASDTDINADDRSYWESENGHTFYNRGDYNMNGDTNSNDPTLWGKNNGLSTSVIR